MKIWDNCPLTFLKHKYGCIWWKEPYFKGKTGVRRKAGHPPSWSTDMVIYGERKPGGDWPPFLKPGTKQQDGRQHGSWPYIHHQWTENHAQLLTETSSHHISPITNGQAVSIVLKIRHNSQKACMKALQTSSHHISPITNGQAVSIVLFGQRSFDLDQCFKASIWQTSGLK